MKGIVLYMSKYGSTKQYGQWIAEELGFELADLGKDKKPDLSIFDTVVIGAPIFASKLKSHFWIERNWPSLSNKKVILFSTSGAKPDNEFKNKVMEWSLPVDIRSKVEYHPFHGRVDPENTGWMDRKMLKIASRMLKDEDIKNDMKNGVDGVRRENILPLVRSIGDHI
jgi:menaquinone-dependent protoporphyrinogen IX oxidase